MPRENFLLPCFELLGSSGHRRKRLLSGNTLKRLRYGMQIMRELEKQLANEKHSYEQIQALRADREIANDNQKLLTAEEKQKLDTFYSRVLVGHPGVDAIAPTQEQIRGYLCNDECTAQWLLVASMMSRIQNRYVVLDGSIKVWNECSNRAEIFLDLSVSLIKYLEPIKVDLQQNAEDILFALRMRLNAIKAFHPIWQDQRTQPQDGHPRQHRFLQLLTAFDVDDLSQTNVAEIYPGADKSLQAILVATTVPVLIICTIPTFFAWQRSSKGVGSRDDSDFWSMLQTQLFQLLNLFTMMFPVSRFTPASAWRLAWAFAMAAGVCCIASPILYVTAPIGWSLLASYMASAAQAVIVLEIMLKSRYSKAKTD